MKTLLLVLLMSVNGVSVWNYLNDSEVLPEQISIIEEIEKGPSAASYDI